MLESNKKNIVHVKWLVNSGTYLASNLLSN